MNEPVLGCSGCATTAGLRGCGIHGGSTAYGPGVAVMQAVTHRHRWVFDGALSGGMLVYHCDDHDPPIVRQVWPGVTL